MAVTIPTIEPTTVRAGDTWAWTRTFADYPATTWTLTYTFWNDDGAFAAVASADGSDHSVSIAPATTATRTAGRYEYTGRVSDGTDTYTVSAGILQVLPAVGSAMDTRSHARKMLDLLNAAQLGKATAQQLETLATAYNGRNLQRDPAFLSKERNRWAQAVANEDQALRLARGDSLGRFPRVRFRS